MCSISSDSAYDEERLRSRVIRLIHAVEKGLCLEEPRLGFGVSKLNTLTELCENYIEKYGVDSFCLRMATDAVDDYLRFHSDRGFINNEIKVIEEKFSKLKAKLPPASGKVGGYQQVAYDASGPSFENIACRRHSVRDFDSTPVSESIIRKAVKIAQMCPSACNRQAVRVYVLPTEKLVKLYENELSGIGGFAQAADKFIVITGKISAYDLGEYNQYIVSASIFASYLSLALLDSGIGSCIVQRPLRLTRENRNISTYCHIPGDEQIVMLMAVGTLKKEFNAPISGRFPVDEIVKFIE